MNAPVPSSPHAADLTEAALLKSALIRTGRPLHNTDDARLRKLELAHCLIEDAMPPETRPVSQKPML